MRALTGDGHDVAFLERDVPWYASQRDLPQPPWGRTFLYGSVEELKERFGGEVKHADLVIVGSYVPQGVEVGTWVVENATGITAFYDLDTPVTMAKLARSDHEYLSPELIARYQLYLSFTGGPTLAKLSEDYGSPRPRAFYCLVDASGYYPEDLQERWDLGYLGTYSDDRQPALSELMLEPARKNPSARFVVAGPQYPAELEWPGNVERIDHLPPARHRSFYNSQRFTLNVTRVDMVKAGYSPSVRLFEAAACGVPIISDDWAGLGSIFEIGEEILVAHSGAETSRYLSEVDEAERRSIGMRARQRVLSQHTAEHRARELEGHVQEIRAGAARTRGAIP